jgi:hypothetical protein
VKIVKTLTFIFILKPTLLAMRQFTFSILIVACLLTACNNNKKTVEATSADGKTTIATDASITQHVTDEMKKEAETLQKLPALSLEELKALLPEHIMGAKRQNYQATSATGAGLATAEYQLNDSTEIQVSIWDCAGPGGAGIYSSRYLGMFNMISENDREYTKTIDFKGQKAIEHCNNSSSQCSITYFTGKRYMVTLEGQNMHPDGLKQAANELKI